MRVVWNCNNGGLLRYGGNAAWGPQRGGGVTSVLQVVEKVRTKSNPGGIEPRLGKVSVGQVLYHQVQAVAGHACGQQYKAIVLGWVYV